MNMKQIFESILSEIDPQAQSSADTLLFLDKMKTDPEFNQMLSGLTLPTDKYKAVEKFAGLLGIPSQRFMDFIQQQNQLVNGQKETQ